MTVVTKDAGQEEARRNLSYDEFSESVVNDIMAPSSVDNENGGVLTPWVPRLAPEGAQQACPLLLLIKVFSHPPGRAALWARAGGSLRITHSNPATGAWRAPHLIMAEASLMNYASAARSRERPRTAGPPRGGDICSSTSLRPPPMVSWAGWSPLSTDTPPGAGNRLPWAARPWVLQSWVRGEVVLNVCAWLGRLKLPKLPLPPQDLFSISTILAGEHTSLYGCLHQPYTHVSGRENVHVHKPECLCRREG